MRCPNCNSLQIHVIDLKPKPKDKIIKRRREYMACGFRFNTYEEIQNPESAEN